jgi:hypothetical protein
MIVDTKGSWWSSMVRIFSFFSLAISPEIDATTCFREQTYDKDTIIITWLPN